MMDGAEDEAKSAKEVPAVLSNYPSLRELRRRESRYYFWKPSARGRQERRRPHPWCLNEALSGSL
jgi:hypothetical protein